MNKEVDRRLLAYIQYEGSSEVCIDIVEISRRSTSFHYQGIAWNRPPNFIGQDNCTDAHGNKCRIAPLNRNHTPVWAESADVVVNDNAKGHYHLWLAGKIKPAGKE
ncbi:hypothetical protein E4656_03380 [Natronospirillum operosum]|uniref:Uncharacterized protein n=1 Tax=Natronospirillum operosum TaxID=2759953 RepID=A0A4Z0WFU3_9GAMM|nr:hypothetical protein [Natronospirillum operosum]TGG95478.1 hypothetical protein E4656_03380 [Natronospirillum operosum]